MRRKDILIISATVIVIAFVTVLGIYITQNKIVMENMAKSLKKSHHTNGWEIGVVDEIVDNVPVPVGFTHIEGDKETGIIIENNLSKEKYMWIPKTEEVNTELYKEMVMACNLGYLGEEARENIEKYDGFYIELDESARGNIIKTLSEEERYELSLKNESKGEVVETHLTTAEEMAAKVEKLDEGWKRI